jgi:TPR repeat protein
MGTSYKNARFLIESRMRDAARGNPDALYDLGICYSTGASGVDIDLIEAHKFFNLAAVSGLDCAADARADIAEDMTAREISMAQAAARAWLGSMQRRAA